MPPFDPDFAKPQTRRELFLAGFFLALSGILLILPVGAQQQISWGLRSTLLAPFIWTQESLREARARAVEVGAIQARLDSATALLAVQSTLLEENTRLRALLDLRERAGPAFVSASAVHAGTRGSEGMFLLDVGSDEGVAVHDPVISEAGLVGVVREVGPRTALALDWTHPDFRVGVMTLAGDAFGIVEPSLGAFREETRLLLNGVPFHTELEEGARLVTSGMGVYPRGIRVGEVLALAEAEAGWRRSYWIRPAVSAGRMNHVLVVTGDAGDSVMDLRHLWEVEGEEGDGVPGGDDEPAALPPPPPAPVQEGR